MSDWLDPWRPKTVLSGDHFGWGGECFIGEPVVPKPWFSAVQITESGDVWSYRTVCRHCLTEVTVHGAEPDRFCKGCGESLRGPDQTNKCVVCGTRVLMDSLKRQHPYSSIFIFGSACHECGHTERATRIPKPDGTNYQVFPARLSAMVDAGCWPQNGEPA